MGDTFFTFSHYTFIWLRRNINFVNYLGGVFRVVATCLSFPVSVPSSTVNQLPPVTTDGLHHLVAHARAYDYPSCLTSVNALVSSAGPGAFAILSEFLPGVKVLVQVATQLGVYLDPPAAAAAQ